MPALCLDTNTYSAHRAGNPEAVRIIGAADQVWLPAPVLGELRAGFLKGNKTAENELGLQAFLAADCVHVATVDEACSRLFAQVFDQLRKAGTPIPMNDVWIAACALKAGCALYTLDAHFKSVDGLLLVQSSQDWADYAS